MITNETMDFIDYLMNVIFDRELSEGNLIPDLDNELNPLYTTADAAQLLDIFDDMNCLDKCGFQSERKSVDKCFMELLTHNMNEFYKDNYKTEGTLVKFIFD